MTEPRTAAQSWWGRHGYRLTGGVAVAVSLAVTVLLAVLGVGKEQPTVSTSALLVLVAAVFQGVGAWLFARGSTRHAPDRDFIVQARRRVYKLSQRAVTARELAEYAYPSAPAAEVKLAMGRLSADLSWIEEGLLDSLGDWQTVARRADPNLDAETPDE